MQNTTTGADGLQIRVRRARRQDIPRLREMIAALARHHGDVPATGARALERDLFGPEACATALVALRRETPVGYAVLTAFPHLQFGLRLMDLNHLFVDAAHRGVGAGRLLVAAAVQEARRQQCGRMVVATHPDNRHAQALYRALGFRPAARPGLSFHLDLPEDGALPEGWI